MTTSNNFFLMIFMILLRKNDDYHHQILNYRFFKVLNCLIKFLMRISACSALTVPFFTITSIFAVVGVL